MSDRKKDEVEVADSCDDDALQLPLGRRLGVLGVVAGGSGLGPANCSRD